MSTNAPRSIIDLRSKNIPVETSMKPGDVVIIAKDDYLLSFNEDGSFTFLGHPREEIATHATRQETEVSGTEALRGESQRQADSD